MQLKINYLLEAKFNLSLSKRSVSYNMLKKCKILELFRIDIHRAGSRGDFSTLLFYVIAKLFSIN